MTQHNNLPKTRHSHQVTRPHVTCWLLCSLLSAKRTLRFENFFPLKTALKLSTPSVSLLASKSVLLLTLDYASIIWDPFIKLISTRYKSAKEGCPFHLQQLRMHISKKSTNPSSSTPAAFIPLGQCTRRKAGKQGMGNALTNASRAGRHQREAAKADTAQGPPTHPAGMLPHAAHKGTRRQAAAERGPTPTTHRC